MAYDWFIVPLVREEMSWGEVVTPKYADQVDAFSGNWQNFGDQKYKDLPWWKEDRYTVRFYADESVLNSVYENNSDAYALYRDPDVAEADVAEYLNDINGKDLTFSEWEEAYQA